jgi:hypothetical protein
MIIFTNNYSHSLFSSFIELKNFINLGLDIIQFEFNQNFLNCDCQFLIHYVTALDVGENIFHKTAETIVINKREFGHSIYTNGPN